MVTLSSDVSAVVQIFILVIGIYRALTMRRGFIDPVYRSRALWSAALMFVIILANLNNFISLPNDTISNVIGFSPFVAIVLVSYAYVDRSVMVAVSTDFFHRNTLHWLQFRRLGYGLMAASTLITYGSIIVAPQYLFASGPTSAQQPGFGIVFYQFFAVIIFVLGISALALGVASRRTSDRNLRKSIRLLGYALGLFVVSLSIGILSNSAAANVAGNILTLGATYFLYLSTISLTALGRVEKT